MARLREAKVFFPLTISLGLLALVATAVKYGADGADRTAPAATSSMVPPARTDALPNRPVPSDVVVVPSEEAQPAAPLPSEPRPAPAAREFTDAWPFSDLRVVGICTEGDRQLRVLFRNDGAAVKGDVQVAAQSAYHYIYSSPYYAVPEPGVVVRSQPLHYEWFVPRGPWGSWVLATLYGERTGELNNSNEALSARVRWDDPTLACDASQAEDARVLPRATNGLEVPDRTQPKPNLVIVEVCYADERLFATFINAGRSFDPPPFGIRWRANGKTVTNEGLRGNDRTASVAIADLGLKPGKRYDVRADIDYANAVDEGDEDNNSRLEKVRIARAHAPCPTGWPEQGVDPPHPREWWQRIERGETAPGADAAAAAKPDMPAGSPP